MTKRPTYSKRLELSKSFEISCKI